ncbi:hypothetical protein F7Q99_29025 [Streptomyces kaniharaensis]|uniref:Uncharacterized protein n=1 Tax=Streptomyces kaniharaensis TaxID=212423 RepID=A0A6N7L2Y4_9ACTN|nr:hypothetical protein [Streptomyces kaniharaensis]
MTEHTAQLTTMCRSGRRGRERGAHTRCGGRAHCHSPRTYSTVDTYGYVENADSADTFIPPGEEMELLWPEA